MADHATPYKGRFDFTTVGVPTVTSNGLLVRGPLTGNETHLGRFTGEVEYLVDLTTPTFAFEGTLTKTAANGDRLVETVTGQLTEEGSSGEFTIIGGTGRFQGASGGGTFNGTWTDAARTTTRITFDGSLTFAGLGNYPAEGAVAFSNVQGATQAGGVAPYLAVGDSPLIGRHTQFGSILSLSGLAPVDATTLVFYSEVGPNQFLPGNPKVHVIDTKDGQIFCTWTAVFTLKLIDSAGTAVFNGDGDFTVVGGTGKYKGATGRFTTLFETQPVPPGADQAFAGHEQFGEVRRH
jgi:hypothetical protein